MMSIKAIRGMPASPGIAIGPVLRYDPQKFEALQEQSEDVQDEVARLQAALEQARQELQRLSEQARRQVSAAEAAIFEAHEMILSDPQLLQRVHTTMERGLNAAYAWQEGTRHYMHRLQGLKDAYLSARALDIEDVSQRVLRILQGKKEHLIQLLRPSIIVAADLTPSTTMRLDRGKVLAFCTATGGPTSHVAILAKALGIPAITGVGSGIDELYDDLQVIVDGNSGEVVLEPDQATRASYQRRAQAFAQAMRQALDTAHLPACTCDGKRCEVAANIGAPEQVAEALAHGAEGIGLLRTEFLFMDRLTAPSEEEQVKVYRAILAAMGQSPVVARTFDIGGDKPVPYITMPVEMNPFLGVRGIRLALAQPDLLQTQLRALLRACTGPALSIMFPMVSSSEEVQDLREHVKRARETLKAKSIDIAEHIQIGIMIEVPAAAIMADVLAEDVDFFSIGTNDLAQYTLAEDRTNEARGASADALHPAVLRLIHMVITAASTHRRWVGLCGELAGDPLAVPVLLGLGLDKLSMSPRAIPLCKQNIRRWSMEEAQEIARQAMKLRNAVEVRAYLADVCR